MSQNSQLRSLHIGEGMREASEGSQRCAAASASAASSSSSGTFWLPCPPPGLPQIRAQWPRKEAPRSSLEEAPRDQALEGPQSQDRPYPTFMLREPTRPLSILVPLLGEFPEVDVIPSCLPPLPTSPS